MAQLFDPHFQAVNANSLPLSGAKLYFYQALTTTPITVYQDADETTPHTNPVLADASGLFPPIYVPSVLYKFVLQTSAGVTVQTADEIDGGAVPDGDKGDITVSNNGETWEIDPGVISYDKLDARLKGHIDGWVTPRDFVANAGTGGDDTAAVQAAMAVDAPLYLERPYRIAAACDYAGGKTKVIRGNGDTSSTITMTAAAGHGLSKSAGTLIVEGVGITTTIDKASQTAAIYLGGGLSGRDLVDNCRLYGASGTVRLAVGVHVATDVITTIRSNYIVTCREYGALLQNSVTNGGGEAVVFGNTFNTEEAGNTASAISWTTGLGAQRVIGNIIQSYAIGLNVFAGASLTKGSLLVVGNSFESNQVSSILIDRGASAARLQAVVINGNDFQQSLGGKAFLVQDGLGTLADWARSIQFHDNSVRFGLTAPVQFAAGYLASVDGNIFEATVSGLACIVVNPSAPTLGRIGSNLYAGASITPYVLNGNTGWTKVSTAAA